MPTRETGSITENEVTFKSDFDVLYQRYRAMVFSFAYHLTQNRGEAEDLFQDAWLRIVKNLPEKVNIQGMKAWIFTIVANLHRDSLRKKRVRRLYLAKVSPPDLYSVNEQTDLGKDIARAIAGLPYRQRRVFILKEIAGFQQAEIGDMLGIPLGTVKSLMHRAVKRLRRDLLDYSPKSLERRSHYAL